MNITKEGEDYFLELSKARKKFIEKKLDEMFPNRHNVSEEIKMRVAHSQYLHNGIKPKE